MIQCSTISGVFSWISIHVSVALWVSALISMLFVIVSPPSWSTFGLVYAAATLQLGMLGSRVGRFGPAAVAWPLLVVVFIVIFACSTVQTAVLRRARWSGRSIPLHHHG